MIFDVIRTISYPEISPSLLSEVMSIKSQLNSLPTPKSKMARTKISAKPRRSPRLENKTKAPAMPVLSRNRQRSRILQEIEGLLHEELLTIENFIDHETSEILNDEFAHLRQRRTTYNNMVPPSNASSNTQLPCPKTCLFAFTSTMSAS